MSASWVGTTHPRLPKKPVEPAGPPCGALTRAVCGRGRHKWCPGGLQGRRRRTAKWRLSILRSAEPSVALRICKSGARRVALIAPRTRPQRRDRTGVATTSALHADWLTGDKRAFGVGAVSGETHASTKGGKAAPAGPTFKAVKSSARAGALSLHTLACFGRWPIFPPEQGPGRPGHLFQHEPQASTAQALLCRAALLAGAGVDLEAVPQHKGPR